MSYPTPKTKSDTKQFKKKKRDRERNQQKRQLNKRRYKKNPPIQNNYERCRKTNTYEVKSPL